MRLYLLVFSIFATFAQAADPRYDDAVPEPPDLPMPVESGKAMEPDEPEITIRRRGNKTIQEYRVNGELYMVKIVPDIGPAYYLMDSNGDGNMDVRHSTLQKGIKVPQWVLFSW